MITQVCKGQKYEGEPCVKCGSTERYLTGNHCVKCKAARDAAWAQRNPNKVKRNNRIKRQKRIGIDPKKTAMRRAIEDHQSKEDYL